MSTLMQRTTKNGIVTEQVFDRNHRATFNAVGLVDEVQIHGQFFTGPDARRKAQFASRVGGCGGCDVLLRNHAAAALKMVPAQVVNPTNISEAHKLRNLAKRPR